MGILHYACHQRNMQLSNLMATAPGELTLVAGDTAVGREDTKLLYNKRVYNFELESNITTALKDIMDKLDTSSYVVLKQKYVGYVGRSRWEFINHLLTAYGENT